MLFLHFPFIGEMKTPDHHHFTLPSFLLPFSIWGVSLPTPSLPKHWISFFTWVNGGLLQHRRYTREEETKIKIWDTYILYKKFLEGRDRERDDTCYIIHTYCLEEFIDFPPSFLPSSFPLFLPPSSPSFLAAADGARMPHFSPFFAITIIACCHHHYCATLRHAAFIASAISSPAPFHHFIIINLLCCHFQKPACCCCASTYYCSCGITAATPHADDAVTMLPFFTRRAARRHYYRCYAAAAPRHATRHAVTPSLFLNRIYLFFLLFSFIGLIWRCNLDGRIISFIYEWEYYDVSRIIINPSIVIIFQDSGIRILSHNNPSSRPHHAFPAVRDSITFLPPPISIYFHFYFIIFIIETIITPLYHYYWLMDR